MLALENDYAGSPIFLRTHHSVRVLVYATHISFLQYCSKSVACLFFTGIGIRLNYNVALKQPVWQLSTYGISYASISVDGSRSSTSGTNSGNNIWWAVDLGRLTYVENVTITPDRGWRKFCKTYRSVRALYSYLHRNAKSKPFSNFSNCIILINWLVRLNYWKTFL